MQGRIMETSTMTAQSSDCTAVLSTCTVFMILRYMILPVLDRQVNKISRLLAQKQLGHFANCSIPPTRGKIGGGQECAIEREG